MKKKITTLFLVLILMVTTLSGCGLFSVQQDLYLEQTVCKMGDIEIDREQLINTCNSYVSELIQNYSYTQKEAVEYCIDLCLNREIVLKNAKASDLEFTAVEKTTIVKNAFDYLASVIKNYEDEVKAEEDLKTAIPESTGDLVVYKPYKKTATIAYDEDASGNKINFRIEQIKDEDGKVNETYVSFLDTYMTNGDKNKNILSMFKSVWTPEIVSVGEKAYERTAKAYRSNYDKYKKMSFDEIIIDRLYKQLDNAIDDMYISATESRFKDNIKSEITPQMIMQVYNATINANLDEYSHDEAGKAKYVTDILSSATGKYYTPLENEFCYVSHVLLKYTDEQQEQVKVWDEQLNNGAITQIEYDAKINTLQNEMLIVAKDKDGKDTEVKKNVYEVLSEIESSLASSATFEEKAKAFNEFVYKYNGDTGIQNKERDYVIGLENAENKDESRSQMVESFTKASRDMYMAYLYKQGIKSKADMLTYLTGREYITYNEADSKYYDKNNVVVNDSKILSYFGDNYYNLGTLGATSKLVSSTYGYHIIMLTGSIQNIVLTNNGYTSSGNYVNDCYILDQVKTTAHDDKTVFNEIYDLVVNSISYDATRTNIIREYKANNQKVIYTSRIKDLY